ncbi:DNA replication protein [Serendipita sp. 399]|nr:DNA replication protein [Serendipita sp. 399]
MDDEYYSLDAILAENQKIECTFNIDVPGLGYLDNGTDEDLKALTKLQLPYWLAPTMLYATWAGFNMPRPFNGVVQKAVIAEPRSVRIGALVGENGRWYTFGKMIVDLLSDPQAKELADILKLASGPD